MSDFQGSTRVNRSAREVWSFVSNPENIPKYVPEILTACREKMGGCKSTALARLNTLLARQS